jgi:hypothetical protein
MTQAVALAQQASTGVSQGFKNRIINGNMVIDQRYAGAATANTISGYTLDRWNAVQTTTGKLIVQQNAGSVTPPAGFTNYLGVTSQSAYSIGAGDFYAVLQSIEGYNLADLNWGTANAKTVTLSFWVRSSLTGTFGLCLNNGGTRSYPFTYTISSANTWEQKSITVAGDQSGTWNATNGTGVQIWFGLGVGSTNAGPVGAWASANYVGVSSAVSVVGTNGATFYITGVQLEVGSTATNFETRSYTTELQLCQRYYETSGVISAGGYVVTISTGTNSISSGSTTANYVFGTLGFAVSKRTNPTMTINGAGGTANTVSIPWFGTDLNANSGALWTSGTYGFNLYNASGVTLSAGNFAVSFSWKASAEL